MEMAARFAKSARPEYVFSTPFYASPQSLSPSAIHSWPRWMPHLHFRSHGRWRLALDAPPK